MRALKIAGIVIASLLAVVVLAVAVLLLVIDPNDYKAQLAALVKKKTDMTLVIEDRLEWTLWPNLGLRLGRTRLSDDARHETLVAVGQAAVSVELLPLFSKKINIDAVSLHGAKLRFIQYADGSTSWDRMLAKLQSAPEEESQQVALRVKTLEVKDGSLYLKDEKAGVERTVDGITAQARDIGMQKPFPFQLQFAFRQQDAAGQTLIAANTVDARITLDPEKKRYVLAPLALTSALSGSALPAPANLELKGEVWADLGAQQVRVKALQLKASYADKALKAPATVDMTAEVLADLGQHLLAVDRLRLRAAWPEATRPQPLAATLTGTLRTSWATGALELSPLALEAVVPDKAYPRPLPVSLSAPLTGNWKEGRFTLPTFVLSAAGVRAEGTLAAVLPALQAPAPAVEAAAPPAARPLTAGMTLSGRLDVAPFNPRSTLAALGIAAPQTADANVLKRASLSAVLQGDEQKFLLKNLRLGLDDSTLTGEAGLSDLKTLRQYARLNLDRLDADRYLPPPAPAAPANAATPPTPKPAAPGGVLPVALLKKQNLDIALAAGSLKLLTYPVTGFRIAATAGNGVLNVSEFKGSIFKGGFSVPLRVDVQGAQPVLSLQPRLNGMEIGPLARKLLKKDLLEGRASYEGALTLRGNSTAEWMQSVSGTSNLALENGLLHGVNAMRELNDALGRYQALLALFGKDLGAEAEKQNDTQIASFSAINTLDKGVVNSTSLNADLRKAKVAGSGSFNLVTQALDYRFTLNLGKEVAGGRYAAYPLPVQCKGSLAGSLASLCRLDSRAVADLAIKAAAAKGLEKLGLPGGNAKEAVQQKAEEEKQKAKEKLNQELNKGLQKLFGR